MAGESWKRRLNGWLPERRFLLSGLGAVADQGLVSVGNFATALIAGRNLTPEQYGTYVVLYGTMVVLNTLHASLVSQYLLVSVGTKEEREFRTLAGVGLTLTVVGAILPLVLGGAAGWIAGRPVTAGLAIAALFGWQFQETLRMALVARGLTGTAMFGDAISYLGQAGLALWLAGRGWLTLDTLLGAILATSALAAVVQSVQVRPRIPDMETVATAWRELWGWGRWSALSRVVNSVSAYLLPWTLAGYFGTSAAGSMQAVENVLMVTNPLLMALQNMTVSNVAGRLAAGGEWVAVRYGLRLVWIAWALIIPYFLLLLAWPEMALRLFYGEQSAYTTLQGPLRLAVLAYAFQTLSWTTLTLLVGVKRMRETLEMQLAGIGAAAVIGVPLALTLAVPGALIGMAMANALRALVGLRRLMQVPERAQ